VTRIKICGLTESTDCSNAVKAGAHMLGFNFWPGSKRHITAEQASELMARVPDTITKVGLFVDAEPALVRAVLAGCSLDLLQFHGNESPEYCRQFGQPYMKAFRLSDNSVVARIPDYLEHNEHPFLVDAYVPGEVGGTGRQISLELALMARECGDCMVLAGGLNPQNVAAAVAATEPWAVDVASGVESSPGRKTLKQLSAFVAAVKTQDAQGN
jgi:phosphoribosylanthranilate isomerase